MEDLRNPPRAVFGFINHGLASIRVIKFLTSTATKNLTFTDATTAEATKYASNVMLAARLTVANEVALRCAELGADGREAVRLAGQDPRIGSQYLQVGAGWGGSCFPKDVQAFAVASESALVFALDIANDWHTAWTRDVVERALDVLAWRRTHRLAAGQIVPDTIRVAILGSTFKPETNDDREARHVGAVQAAVVNHGVANGTSAQVEVGIWDPSRSRPHVPTGSVPWGLRSWIRAIPDADVIVLGTAWRNYTDAPWPILRPDQILIDCRGALSDSLKSRCTSATFGRPLPALLASKSAAPSTSEWRVNLHGGVR